ncbi:hypothetical protein HMPREF1570_5027 [Klebsiella oxytoca KA-2]|nr:hypothetical protein HMPREF1570_5027 [Klebsiella oxytoca KA-2]
MFGHLLNEPVVVLGRVQVSDSGLPEIRGRLTAPHDAERQRGECKTCPNNND